jgi:hypothetical protein
MGAVRCSPVMSALVVLVFVISGASCSIMQSVLQSHVDADSRSVGKVRDRWEISLTGKWVAHEAENRT